MLGHRQVAAYLLGPKLRVVQTREGKRYLADVPPLPVFANRPIPL